MSKAKVLTLVIYTFYSVGGTTYLRVKDDHLEYAGQKVFLSGTNAAWIEYGRDFGLDGWEEHGDLWREELNRIAEAGGNTVRTWVHIEGEFSPLYDKYGYVVATDGSGSLVNDLKAFLDECQKRNLFMVLVLFNGAKMRTKETINMIKNEVRLQSYLDNALVPMILGLRDHPSLAAWEVMNEPEGATPPGQTNNEPCFDLTHLDWSKSRGPGWSGANISIKDILKLHNWVSHTIHSYDTKALVMAGSWQHLATTFGPGEDPVHKFAFNHYMDECLVKAGGYELGIMDMIQFHVYPWGGEWHIGAPWTGLNASSYKVDKPIIIGEFPSRKYVQSDDNEFGGSDLPDGATTEEMVEFLYTHGYSGGFSWAYLQDMDEEVVSDVMAGMMQLRGRTDHGLINIIIEKN